MAAGFPKHITKTRIRRGKYVVERDDGKRFEIVRGVGHWWVNASWTRPTLSAALFDIRNDYTAADQLSEERAR